MGKSIDSDEPDVCMWKDCRRTDCKKPWHRPCTFSSQKFEERLRPLLIVVGVTELIVGGVFLALVLSYAEEYDKMYGTERNKFISFTTFGGLTTLTTSGMILLVSVLMGKRRTMWVYIVMSTLLSIFIFVLSIIKIHLALMALSKETVDEAINNKFMLSTACISGVFTLLGSVIHFVGIVPVFTYYNFKYIQPVMFGAE